MRTRLVACCLMLIFFTTCKKDGIGKLKEDDSIEISPKARDYLTSIISIMENNSINRYKIDWIDFKKKVFDAVPHAQSIEDTYPGIKEALKMIADNHSFYIASNGNTISVSTLQYTTETIDFPTITPGIGYVKVDAFSGNSNDYSAQNFANQIQSQIRSQDRIDLKGWIVDLRNDGGGNMYPMIAGIGPILGEGIAGYFIKPDGVEISWGFQDGASYYDGHSVTLISNSYQLIVPNPKVAVLLNSGVASSGEVVAVSFIGRPNTKSFGSPTMGLSTANLAFALSDNALLYLTTAYQADRNKKLYGVPIDPDMVSSKETIINDAIAWIKN